MPNRIATWLWVCFALAWFTQITSTIMFLLIRYRLSSCSDSMREGKVLILEHTFGRLDAFFVAWRLHLQWSQTLWTNALHILCTHLSLLTSLDQIRLVRLDLFHTQSFNIDLLPTSLVLSTIHLFRGLINLGGIL